MAVRDDRSDVKQTTTGFRGPLMVQSLTSAKSKFLSLIPSFSIKYVLYFLYFLYFQSRQVERGAWSLARHRQFGFNHR